MAVRAPHVLLIEAPGAWRIRVAAEQEMSRRGWRSAASPADADALMICGRPPAAHTDAVEQTWDQLAGPRARLDLTDATTAAVIVAMERIVQQLLDDPAQRADARTRPAFAGDSSKPQGAHSQEHELDAPDTEDAGTGHHVHPGSTQHVAGDNREPHGEMDHGQMDHGGMDMTGPGGIPLATGGPDRDGLEMDVLHLRLGPVLSCWPPGLVLNVALQGDVVTEASVEPWQGSEAGSDDDEDGDENGLTSAARRCDAAATLLRLSGWSGPATRARLVRDLLLDPGVAQGAVDTLEDLLRRVGRSRLLRWSLRDLAPVGRDRPEIGDNVSDVLDGDVHGRLLRMLELARNEALSGLVTTGHDGGDPADQLAVVLPAMVVGLDMAAVRLTVASVAGLMPTSRASTSPGSPHG